MLYYNNQCNCFDYEFEDVIKLFFLQDEIKKTDEPWDEHLGVLLLCRKNTCDGQESISIRLKARSFDETVEIPGHQIDLTDKNQFKKYKRILKRKLFLLLQKYTGKTIPWGILTGIRPAKLVNEFLDKGLSRDGIISILQKDYFVTDSKANLLYEVAENQRNLFLDSKPDSVSLYIGIPFCPTRCLYCSFSSSTIAQYRKMIDSYIAALKKEIKCTAGMLKANKLQVESIYIGGGTPTSINSSQLSTLLEGIEEYLELDCLKEYTIEAGRPDTVDCDKLNVIKSSRVSRISINPQTMNAATLENIGRKHSPEDIERAYFLARSMGFDNINMDLICGLPGENIKMFANTLERIRALAPDSLTVHTMSLKRASRLTQEKENYSLSEQHRQVSEMVERARMFAGEMGLNPYYLYRQKNILGNLENVGYSKPGKECLYNIQIMEERQSIFACGAGAVSKFVFPGDRIERAFNVKSVEEYTGRIDEMINRKAELCTGSK